MSISKTILDICKSFIIKKGESYFASKFNQSIEEKEVLKVFGNALMDFIEKQTGKNESGMINDFIQTSDIYILLKKCFLIDEKEEAIKKLTSRFKIHSRGSFDNEFNHDECIQYAVSQVLHLHGTEEQRNFLSVSDQINKLNTTSSNKQTHDPINILKTFSLEKDRVFPEECFFDYDSAIQQVESLWNRNHIIQIIGPKGSGKKQIAAHLPLDKSLHLFIKASQIKTKDSFVKELSSRFLPEQSLSSEAVSHFFVANPGYTIIFVDAEEINTDLKDYLCTIPCKTIVTSTKSIISDIPTYHHYLPTVKQGIQIYINYLSIKDSASELTHDNETICKLIEDAGRIPECIRYIALYQLYVDEKIDISELQARIHDEKEKDMIVLTPTEYMRTILSPQIHFSPQMKNILKTLSIVPNKMATKRFLQYIIDEHKYDFTIQDLISKGYGSLKTIDNCDIFIGSALIYIPEEEYEDEFYIQLGIDIFKYVHFFPSSNNYSLKEVFEACELCDFYFETMYEMQPDPSWALSLTTKAELYEYLGLHQLCINECNRILAIQDIEKMHVVITRTKITFSRALAEYGLYEQADAILQSIPEDKTTEIDRFEIKQIVERIDFEKQQFDKLIVNIKSNISDDPYERIGQFHQLATMNYHLGKADEAKEYFELARSLIDKLHYENTTIASMIYAAGSAIYLTVDNPNKSIEYGKKSLEIATNLSKKVNSHILTSYNNLGNAYLVARQYKLARDSFSYVINNYGEVLSPNSPLIVHAKTNAELCTIMENSNYNSKTLEHLMIDIAKDKNNYNDSILCIITAGVVAAEHGDFVRLKRLLDISQKWIDGFIEYPEIDMCCLMMNRLFFAENVGSSFLANSKSKIEGYNLYKNTWEYIKKGFFDNTDKNQYQDSQEQDQIPVYYNCNNEHNNNYQTNFYNVQPFFPPKGTYMGYIISDDSMMPQIQKGDIIWVTKKQSPETNDIALFCTNDMKKWICGKVCIIDNQTMLVPNNKEYKATILGQQEQKHFCGVVS